jgi:hypothetical protein
MQAIEPYITDIPSIGDEPNAITRPESWFGWGYPIGWTKTRVVWRIGAMVHSDTAKAKGIHTLGFTWVIATYSGKVLHRMDNLCACELPKRYNDIIGNIGG